MLRKTRSILMQIVVLRNDQVEQRSVRLIIDRHW